MSKPDIADLKFRTAPYWVRGGQQLPLIFEITVGDPDTSGGSYWGINIDKLVDPALGLIRATAIGGGAGTGIPSIPDVNGKPVKNVYVTADGKLKVEFDDGT